MNYIRCDDVPVVFATIIEDADGGSRSPGLLTYSGIGETLTFPFQPEKVCMLPESGRIYHPGPEKVGGVALIKSSLAIELSPTLNIKKETKKMILQHISTGKEFAMNWTIQFGTI